MPIQGGGKGKPEAGAASGAGAEALVPAGVVVAVPLGLERAAEEHNTRSEWHRAILVPLPLPPAPTLCHITQKVTCTGGWWCCSLS